MNNPIIRIDHIAIVSKQSKKIRDLLAKLGIVQVWTGDVPEIKVNCEYFAFPNIDIEIVNPTSDDSIINNFYVKNTASPIHHIAIEVTTLNEGIFYFKKMGYSQITSNVYLAPKLNHIVTFLSPFQTGGLLIELVSNDPLEYNRIRRERNE